MKSKGILSLILNLILAALAIVTIIPFIWMLVSSFAPNSEIVKLGGGLFPGMSTFNNYTKYKSWWWWCKSKYFRILTFSAKYKRRNEYQPSSERIAKYRRRK